MAYLDISVTQEQDDGSLKKVTLPIPPVAITDTPDVDWTAGSIFTFDTTSPPGITFENVVDGKTIVLILSDTGGPWKIRWNSPIVWLGGGNHTSTMSGDNVYTFFSAGGTVFGRAESANFAPYDATEDIVNAEFSADLQNGDFQRIDVSAATTILAPTNGTDGQVFKLLVADDGGGWDLTFDIGGASGLLLPSESTAFTNPKTLIASGSYVIVMQLAGTRWWLNMVEGAYSEPA